MSQKKYIAVDLGAESGRVMLGTVSTDNLILEEIHRFANGPLEQNNSLRWDFEKLFREIKTGIAQALVKAEIPVAGIAVDSWGVDFGLIDRNGMLIENPYHYRDSRTDGMLEKAFELMPKREIYQQTGIQFMQLNTAYQLLAMRQAKSPVLTKAHKLIFMADLVAYRLSGEIFAEYTLASTSQLMNMKTGRWARDIFKSFDLPSEIMPDLVQPGTVVGKLKNELAEELHCDPVPVIAAGSHDTTDAVAAVPARAEGENWAYLSCGTWSLMGVELDRALITDKIFQYQFTNEGGVQNTIRFLKNIMGLWFVQECKRQWEQEGTELSYAQITDRAQKAPPFTAYIDPNHNDFLSPGDMPTKINQYLTANNLPAINDKGQMIRVILESLALEYRKVVDLLENVTGKSIDVLHMVGGGIQNELLCQFTANALGRKVVAGPIEATATGNIIMQALATGQINSLVEARAIIRNSFDLKTYQPQDRNLWKSQYQKFRK